MCSASRRYISSSGLASIELEMLTTQVTKEAHPAARARESNRKFIAMLPVFYRQTVIEMCPLACQVHRALPCNVYSSRKARVGLSCRFYNYRVAFCFDEESSPSIVNHEGSRVINLTRRVQDVP